MSYNYIRELISLYDSSFQFFIIFRANKFYSFARRSSKLQREKFLLTLNSFKTIFFILILK